MSSGTIEGPQLYAKKASTRGPERRAKNTLHMGVARCHNRVTSKQEASKIVGKQATDHKPSRSAWPHHRGLSDAITHRTGEVDDKFVRSTEFHHRSLSDAGIDSIEGLAEGRPIRHLDLII